MSQWYEQSDVWCTVVRFCKAFQHAVLWSTCRAARVAVGWHVRREAKCIRDELRDMYISSVKNRSLHAWRRDQLLFEAETHYRRACAVIASMSVPDLLLFFQDVTPYVCSFMEDVTPTLIEWLTPSLLRILVHGMGIRQEVTDSFWTFLSPTRPVVRQDPRSGLIRFAVRSDEECATAIQQLHDVGILQWVDRTGRGIQEPAALITRSGRVAVFKETVPRCLWIGRYARHLRLKLVKVAMDEGHTTMLVHLLDGPNPPTDRINSTDCAVELIQMALARGFYDCARAVVARIGDERQLLEHVWELYHVRRQSGAAIAIPVQPEPLVDYAREMLTMVGLSARRYLDPLFGMSLLMRECDDRLEPSQIRDGIAWLIEKRLLHPD